MMNRGLLFDNSPIRYDIHSMGNGFFAGRNGSDALSVFLTALALIIAVAASVITNEIARYLISALAIAAVGVALFRMLSTNTAKRRVENERFLSIFRNHKESAEKRKQRREDEKTHAYYKCPECKKELRVPRGKGKIRITCPHCGHQFVKRT